MQRLCWDTILAEQIRQGSKHSQRRKYAANTRRPPAAPPPRIMVKANSFESLEWHLPLSSHQKPPREAGLFLLCTAIELVTSHFYYCYNNLSTSFHHKVYLLFCPTLLFQVPKALESLSVFSTSTLVHCWMLRLSTRYREFQTKLFIYVLFNFFNF